MVDGQPLNVLDTERLRASQPNHTVFNGVHDGMLKKPLPAKPGERVRLYVLNVGPSKSSSFHVVGTIFDRVWLEGNPENQFRGMQRRSEDWIAKFLASQRVEAVYEVAGGMIANLIELQFGQGRNWPLGAALSLTLLVIVTAALLVYVRVIARSGERLG